MRSLSKSEARVILALLAGDNNRETAQLAHARVPRTTYQVIRKRAVLNGWIYDRFVPAPSLVGVDRIGIFVARPFAEHRTEVLQSLGGVPGLVHLVASQDAILAVAWVGPGAFSLTPEKTVAKWCSTLSSVHVRPVADELPAYFDFGGAWSHFVGEPSARGYPRSVPRVQESYHPSVRAKAALRGLLDRGNGRGSDGLGGWREAILRPSREERRLIAGGAVSRRAFLDLARLPGYRGTEVERVVIVTADARPGVTAKRVMEDMAREGRASPFLLAVSRDQAVVGLLSPAPAHLVEGRPNLTEILRRHLSEIEIVREPVDSFGSLVDHQYSRLSVV